MIWYIVTLWHAANVIERTGLLACGAFILWMFYCIVDGIKQIINYKG
jgi:hypothetical protein